MAAITKPNAMKKVRNVERIQKNNLNKYIPYIISILGIREL